MSLMAGWSGASRRVDVVAVAVEESGQQRLAGEVYELGGVALHRERLVLGSGEDDPAIIGDQGFDIGRGIAGHGDDGAIVVDRVRTPGGDRDRQANESGQQVDVRFHDGDV